MSDPHDKTLACVVASHSQTTIAMFYIMAMLEEFTPDARQRVIEKVGGMVEGSSPEVRQLWAKVIPPSIRMESKPTLTLIRGGPGEGQSDD